MMISRSLIIIGAFLSLMLVSYASLADDAQEDVSTDLMEAFIGLRMGQGGSSFYRVMVDYDETPYIEIKSFLTDWLGLKPECDSQRLFCSVQLPGEASPRWIDGQNLRMSEAKSGDEIDLIESYIILKDDGIWLNYQALENWIPLRAVWSINAYQMSINTYFKLPKDRLNQRDQLRQREREQKKERQRNNTADHIRVPDSGNQFMEARGEIQTSFDSDKQSNVKLNYDVGGDLYKGRLQAGGSVSDGYSDPLQYWQYQRFDNPFGEYLGLGQVFFEGDLIQSTKVLEDGYRFMRHYQSEGSGEFVLNATVPEEAIVDVYKNGFYEKTVIADKLGQVVLTDIQAGSGDTITLRSITREGAEYDQRFKIAGSANQYLDAKDWDYDLVGGSTTDGDIHSINLKYGLASHLTAGLTLQYSSHMDVSDTKTIASLAFRPHHNVSILWQQELGENNWAYSTDVSLWVNHELRFFGQNSEEDIIGSSLGSLPQDHHGVEHRWGSPRLQAQSRYIHSDTESRFRERVGVKIKHRWDMRLEAERVWHKDRNDLKTRWEMRHIYALSSGSQVEGGIGGRGSDMGWFSTLRWLGDTQAPWSSVASRNRYSFDATVMEQGGRLEPALGLTWYQGDSISGSFRANRDQVGAQIRWKFGFASKTGRYNEEWHKQSWDYFRQGTVQGRLMTPDTGETDSKPLPNTSLWVSNYRTTTDEYGYFRVEGVPVDQSLPVHVDMETLSINMMPSQKQWDINIRPGTVLDFNPPMMWSVGVDGYVSSELYEPGMQIIFEHQTLGVLANSMVEDDGFYIAERLAPGNYEIKLVYISGEITTINIEMNFDSTWVSDFNIEQ